MPFTLNAYLPSFKQDVSVYELNYKQYRDLVKSLYNSNKKETIQQYNSIVADLCPFIKDRDATFEDKLSILLTLRNFCISPDLKLKGTADKDTFYYTVTIDNLLKEVRTINKSATIVIDNITVDISSYKMRDEQVFAGNNKDITIILASYIDTLKIDNDKVEFKDLTIEERVKIVNSLPYALSDKVYESIIQTENYYDSQDLLVVANPHTDEAVLRLSKNITFEVLQKAIEFLFTEDLGNVFRAFYNMVKFAGFSPEYIDSITPVEMQVYWMYYMQDQSEKQKSTSTNNSGAMLPSTSSPNAELGF